MQYPFTMFITEYDNSYSPDVKRAGPGTSPGAGPGASGRHAEDGRQPSSGTAASRRDRPDDGSVNRTGGSESRSLPPEGTAAATAGVLLLLSGGAVSIAYRGRFGRGIGPAGRSSNAAQSAGEAGTRVPVRGPSPFFGLRITVLSRTASRRISSPAGSGSWPRTIRPIRMDWAPWSATGAGVKNGGPKASASISATRTIRVTGSSRRSRSLSAAESRSLPPNLRRPPP